MEEGREVGHASAGGGEEESGEDGWEMMVDPEVPETCCGFARLGNEGGVREPVGEHDCKADSAL